MEGWKRKIFWSTADFHSCLCMYMYADEKSLSHLCPYTSSPNPMGTDLFFLNLVFGTALIHDYTLWSRCATLLYFILKNIDLETNTITWFAKVYKTLCQNAIFWMQYIFNSIDLWISSVIRQEILHYLEYKDKKIY